VAKNHHTKLEAAAAQKVIATATLIKKLWKDGQLFWGSDSAWDVRQ